MRTISRDILLATAAVAAITMGGCASVSSVEHAQATADAANATAQQALQTGQQAQQAAAAAQQTAAAAQQGAEKAQADAAANSQKLAEHVRGPRD
jgi:hypothetical protein